MQKKIKYVGPFDEVMLAHNGLTVTNGHVVLVDEDTHASLAAQTDWEDTDEPLTAIAEFEAALAADTAAAGTAEEPAADEDADTADEPPANPVDVPPTSTGPSTKASKKGGTQ